MYTRNCNGSSLNAKNISENFVMKLNNCKTRDSLRMFEFPALTQNVKQ